MRELGDGVGALPAYRPYYRVRGAEEFGERVGYLGAAVAGELGGIVVDDGPRGTEFDGYRVIGEKFIGEAGEVGGVGRGEVGGGVSIQVGVDAAGQG